ncbi:hypothetical protein RRG08_003436 [Elysia crispata]|uniref:Uncharacterized protein n=1 Tax=Elysia crispata TaxID=231223 RepID=A0AAE1AB29_9GAST|nr:hypothetical protein RRG08_003436 [Elysia crispata]
MEGVHATIEKHLKNMDIFSPLEYVKCGLQGDEERVKSYRKETRFLESTNAATVFSAIVECLVANRMKFTDVITDQNGTRAPKGTATSRPERTTHTIRRPRGETTHRGLPGFPKDSATSHPERTAQLFYAGLGVRHSTEGSQGFPRV